MKHRHKGTAQNRGKKPLFDNITFDDMKDAYAQVKGELKEDVKYPGIFVLAKYFTKISEISLNKKLQKK